MSARKIFLLDDDDLIITVLAYSLKNGGYAVQAETGTEQILDKIMAWSPDVALLDINPPGRSGIDILREIRERGIDTEVIMLTADDTAETAIQAMRLGAAGYLTKPFDTDEVLIVIEKTIENKELRREVDTLRSLAWTGGNVRELRKIIERGMALDESAPLTAGQLSPKPAGNSRGNGGGGKAQGGFILPENGISLEDLEKDLLMQALARTNNNRTRAAKLLKVSYNTIRWQVKKFGLEKGPEGQDC